MRPPQICLFKRKQYCDHSSWLVNRALSTVGYLGPVAAGPEVETRVAGSEVWQQVAGHGAHPLSLWDEGSCLCG